MSDRSRADINEELLEYVERNCSNCYAHLEDDGRIHLDDRFTALDLKAVLKIAGIEL